MNNLNSFELVFCFVFNSFLNCLCFVAILFKFGDIWKTKPPEVFTKKGVLKFLQYVMKRPVSEQVWNFIKKETPAQVFSCDL